MKTSLYIGIMLLQVNNATKDFGGETLFENIHLEIKNKEKVAIIGRNGCGKSTLLKCISGDLELDKGNIVKGGNITIGSLSQKAFMDETLTVQQEFDKVYQHILDIKAKLDILAEKLSVNYSEELLNEYASLNELFESYNGYNYDTEQMTLFTKFGFNFEDLKRPLSTFSGGQKTRLAFVKLLMMKPDILLLDEPTNHLDMATIEWLEGYLNKYPKAIIVVSHDRTFMDHVVSEIYEFEFGSLNHYMGNYSKYVETKKQEFMLQQAAYHRQQEEIERLTQIIEKFRYKKNKAALAQSKIKYLDRMEKIDNPKQDKRNFKVHFETNVRGGNNVLSVDHLKIGYDKPLCEVSFEVKNGNRLAIIGPNGLGKSTLVKTLIGDVEKLGGDFMFGHQIEIGCFDQTLAQFTSNKTVLEEIWDEHPELDKTQVRTVLGSFMFSADDVFKTCDVLSGGEKVRLTIAKIMLNKPNLLILDEPTNHLDIKGKEALEAALQEYSGTIIFVSHDRFFISKIANRILYINKDETKYYELNYQEYLDKLSGKESIKKEEKEEIVVTEAKKQRVDAKRKQTIEKQISKLENRLEELEENRNNEEYYQDYQKYYQLEMDITDVKGEIEKLMNEWSQFDD